ncbi:MAG TPA: hypothetical protein VGC99_04345, partial [Candidatus Tectomicrobia bacterium]
PHEIPPPAMNFQVWGSSLTADAIVHTPYRLLTITRVGCVHSPALERGTCIDMPSTLMTKL